MFGSHTVQALFAAVICFFFLVSDIEKKNNLSRTLRRGRLTNHTLNMFGKKNKRYIGTNTYTPPPTMKKQKYVLYFSLYIDRQRILLFKKKSLNNDNLSNTNCNVSLVIG